MNLVTWLFFFIHFYLVIHLKSCLVELSVNQSSSWLLLWSHYSPYCFLTPPPTLSRSEWTFFFSHVSVVLRFTMCIFLVKQWKYWTWITGTVPWLMKWPTGEELSWKTLWRPIKNDLSIYCKDVSYHHIMQAVKAWLSDGTWIDFFDFPVIYVDRRFLFVSLLRFLCLASMPIVGRSNSSLIIQLPFKHLCIAAIEASICNNYCRAALFILFCLYLA